MTSPPRGSLEREKNRVANITAAGDICGRQYRITRSWCVIWRKKQDGIQAWVKTAAPGRRIRAARIPAPPAMRGIRPSEVSRRWNYMARQYRNRQYRHVLLVPRPARPLISGKAWKEWRRALKAVLLNLQR